MSVTLKYADRVLQTTMTTGEGPFALIAPPPGYRSIGATIGVGVEFRCAVDLPGSDEFVICEATVDSSDILTLGTILISSNGGASVAFPDGEKRVMVVLAAEDIPVLATDGSLDLLGRVSAAEGGYFQGANPLAAGLWTEVGTASGGGFLRAITRGTNVLASMLYDAASHVWKAASTTVMQLSSTALSVGIGVAGFALVVGMADPGGSHALRVGGTMHASGAATFDSTASFGANVTLLGNAALTLNGGTVSITSNGTARMLSLIASGSAAGSAMQFLDGGTASRYNWLVGANFNSVNGLEFTPSTAIGGTSFTTPNLVLLSGGTSYFGADPGGSQLVRVGGTVFASSSITSASTIASSLATGNVFLANSGTTGYMVMEIANSTAFMSLGVCGSSAGSLLSSGGIAYATVLTTVGATALQLGTNQTLALSIDASQNIGLFAAPSIGSGALVLFIGNRSAAPSTNPVGGGILYAEAGGLKWRGSGGTVTAIAAA